MRQVQQWVTKKRIAWVVLFLNVVSLFVFFLRDPLFVGTVLMGIGLGLMLIGVAFALQWAVVMVSGEVEEER